MIVKAIILSIVSLSVLAHPTMAKPPMQWEAGGDISAQIISSRNYMYRDGSRDEINRLAILSPSLSFTRGDVFDGYLLTDLYWIRTDSETPETSAEIVNGFIGVQHNDVYSTIGIQPVVVGNGLVVASNEPAVSILARLPNRYTLNLTLATLFDSSPFATGNIETKPGPFERIQYFTAFVNDTDDFIADTLTPFLPLPMTHSSGYLLWAGTCGDIFIQDSFVRFSFIVQQGDIDLSFSDTSTVYSKGLFAALADVDVSYTLTDKSSIGAFLHVRSGDSSRGSDVHNIFITPAPSQNRSAIFFGDAPGFFDPEIMEYTSTMIPRGVISPGIRWQFSPDEKVFIEMNTAVFYTYNTDNMYGWETDLNLAWDVTPRDAVFLESACFVYKDFFDTAKSPATRLAVSYRRHF